MSRLSARNTFESIADMCADKNTEKKKPVLQCIMTLWKSARTVKLNIFGMIVINSCMINFPIISHQNIVIDHLEPSRDLKISYAVDFYHNNYNSISKGY